MSRSQFENMLKERGFAKDKARGVANILIERQYYLAKTMLLELTDVQSHQNLNEETVNEVAEKLLQRRALYSTKDREEMSAVNMQPLPEVKSWSGPSLDRQLKYPNTTKQLQPNLDNGPERHVLIESDEGPNEDTVFRSSKSNKGVVDFRNIQGEEGDTNKRAADDAMEEHNKRPNVLNEAQ